MDADEFRAACEMADGKLTQVPLAQYMPAVAVWEFPDCGMVEGHPAIKPYVASRLVAKVRERYPLSLINVESDPHDKETELYLCEAGDKWTWDHQPEFSATSAESDDCSEALIGVCMKVLRGE